MSALQILAVLLLASAANAQQLYCSVFGGTTAYSWNPDAQPSLIVQTNTGQGLPYMPNFNCFFSIQTKIPGRIAVSVISSDLRAYSASISIRTDTFTGYLADWTQLTYRVERHRNFVSITNRLYIAFITYGGSFVISNGVQLQLTFLRRDACLPGWYLTPLGRENHCVGAPTNLIFKFGDAQRYCNLQRSNLLVSDQDNVNSVLVRTGNQANVWIGMVAEPNGNRSNLVWINRYRVDPFQQVLCTGGCRRDTHRCVYAQSPQILAQIQCDIQLSPLCYMPVGGTDNFFGDSATVRASGVTLWGAVLLLWCLLR